MCAIFVFGTSTMSRHHHAQSMQVAAGVDCCGRSHLFSFQVWVSHLSRCAFITQICAVTIVES